MNDNVETAQLSLIIPVYNEVESLPVLYEKLLALQDTLPAITEIVFVDDGSDDGSTAILEGFAAANDQVILAVQRRNFGKSTALMVGFALATKEFFVTMDADLQDDPAAILSLRDKLVTGYDIVVGWKHNRQDPPSKTIPSKIANFVTRHSVGLHINDMNSGLKIMRRECAQHLTIYGDLHRYIPAIAHLDGYRVTEVPVTHYPRLYGQSKYGPMRLFRGGFDYLTVIFLGRFSMRPMHFFGTIGLSCFSLGFLFSLHLTIQWLNDIAIGNRPLLLLGILLILMGIQFFTTGFVAELLVTMRQRQQDPLHSVRAVYNAAGHPPA